MANHHREFAVGQVQTLNATQTAAYTSGTLEADAAYLVIARTCGKRTGVAGGGAYFNKAFFITDGTGAIINASVNTVAETVGETVGGYNATWTLNNPNTFFSVDVIGAAAQTIDWVTVVEIIKAKP